MNMEQNIGKAEGRGPSQAAKQHSIEAISQLSEQYAKVKLDIEQVRATPESDEKDETLTALYGTQRMLKDRLEAMGAKPDTVQ